MSEKNEQELTLEEEMLLATTPEPIVEEPVVEEIVEIIPSMDEFEDEIKQGFRKIYSGEIVEGTIISVTDTDLLVNIGYISDGIVPITETMSTEEEPIHDMYSEGDIIKAEVIQKDDGEGNVLLSIKKAQQIIVWDELQEAFEKGQQILVKVKEVVKGGVVCDIKSVRAFIPASQLSTRYIEDLSTFVGETFNVKVADFNKDDKKVVLSRKAVEIEENAVQKKALMSTIKKGDKYIGKVVKLMNFGAFVDIGGVQGLIHINDLSWTRVKHPSEVVKEGDVVDVYVINVDHKTEKIGLGLKDVKEDPWTTMVSEFPVGKVLKGEVQRLMTFGAFVKIAPAVEGLVHISEICEKRIATPHEVLTVGEEVQVKVLNVDPEGRKIQLSIKAAGASEEGDTSGYVQSSEQATTSMQDVFKVFLKDIKN
ncbi:MAG: 30S ribosomal protein S1 [Vallitaleaceae bacterium]|nr:30S ribosomal protein S1 [Vallitaleaceae bacterium]